MDEKIADVLMEFYNSELLAREILRLRKVLNTTRRDLSERYERVCRERDEANRQRQAAAEYQRYHQQATWVDR